MTDKPKFEGIIIPFKGARLAFAKIHKAEPRKSQPGAPPPPADAPKFYSAEILLDPTNVDHQKTIALIKSESVRALNHRLGTPENPNPFTVVVLDTVASGERVPPNFHLAWGYGNALPAFGKKIYDGYKDMFWVRMKRTEKDGPPTLLTGEVASDGKPIQAKEGGKRCPYGGCVAAGTLQVWSYANQSKGVNTTMRTLVWQGDGKAFGGGSVDDAGDFAAIGDLGTPVGGSSGGAPLHDPFAI